MAARLILGGDTSATVRDWDHADALANFDRRDGRPLDPRTGQPVYAAPRGRCAECELPLTPCGVCVRCDPRDCQHWEH